MWTLMISSWRHEHVELIVNDQENRTVSHVVMDDLLMVQIIKEPAATAIAYLNEKYFIAGKENARIFDPGGYEQHKKSMSVIIVNKEMIKDKDMKLDQGTMMIVISACGHLGKLQEPIRSSLTLENLVCESNMPVCNAIILDVNLSLCAYQLLLDTKGQSKDKSENDCIAETLKDTGIKLINHSCNKLNLNISAGRKYKAETIAKEKQNEDQVLNGCDKTMISLRQEDDNAHYKLGTYAKASKCSKKVATCIKPKKGQAFKFINIISDADCRRKLKEYKQFRQASNLNFFMPMLRRNNRMLFYFHP